MHEYTITITQPDGLGDETVITLLFDDTNSRITELKMTATDARGLSTAELPSIDFGLLLAALTPRGRSDAGDAPLRLPGTGRRSVSREPVATSQAREARTAHRATAGERRGSLNGIDQAEDGRHYRVMPDNFVDVYAKLKSVPAVAEYFDVPRHTVTAWLRTARKRGVVAPARARRQSR